MVNWIFMHKYVAGLNTPNNKQFVFIDKLKCWDYLGMGTCAFVLFAVTLCLNCCLCMFKKLNAKNVKTCINIKVISKLKKARQFAPKIVVGYVLF